MCLFEGILILLIVFLYNYSYKKYLCIINTVLYLCLLNVPEKNYVSTKLQKCFLFKMNNANNNKCIKNHYIRMISKGLCDT